MRSPGRALHAHQLSPKSTMSGKRYKGVRMRSWGKWVSEIRIPNSRNKIWLGSYSSPEEAARAYDAAATSLRGSSSSLNFPDSPPQIVPGSLTPRSIQATAAAAAAAVAISVETNPNSSSDVAGSAYKSECSSSSSSDLVIYSANMQRMDDQSPITLPANVFNGVEPLEEPCRIQESTHPDALAQPGLETPNSTLGETNERFSASGNIFEELYRLEQEMSCLQDLENHGLVAISDPVTSSHRFDIDSGTWMETSLWSL